MSMEELIKLSESNDSLLKNAQTNVEHYQLSCFLENKEAEELFRLKAHTLLDMMLDNINRSCVINRDLK